MFFNFYSAPVPPNCLFIALKQTFRATVTVLKRICCVQRHVDGNCHWSWGHDTSVCLAFADGVTRNRLGDQPFLSLIQLVPPTLHQGAPQTRLDNHIIGDCWTSFNLNSVIFLTIWLDCHFKSRSQSNRGICNNMFCVSVTRPKPENGWAATFVIRARGHCDFNFSEQQGAVGTQIAAPNMDGNGCIFFCLVSPNALQIRIPCLNWWRHVEHIIAKISFFFFFLDFHFKP